MVQLLVISEKYITLTIGERTAEAIKIEIGSARATAKPEKMEINRGPLSPQVFRRLWKSLLMKLSMRFANPFRKLLKVSRKHWKPLLPNYLRMLWNAGLS